MDKISTLNTLKNVFSALGAKTSDSNYAVGLFDKTTAEPAGIMGMSDLASVLGVQEISFSDFDSLNKTGCFVVNGTKNNGPYSTRYPYKGFVLNYIFSVYKFQVYMDCDSNPGYIGRRAYNGVEWRNWEDL